MSDVSGGLTGDRERELFRLRTRLAEIERLTALVPDLQEQIAELEGDLVPAPSDDGAAEGEVADGEVEEDDSGPLTVEEWRGLPPAERAVAFADGRVDLAAQS